MIINTIDTYVPGYGGNYLLKEVKNAMNCNLFGVNRSNVHMPHFILDSNTGPPTIRQSSNKCLQNLLENEYRELKFMFKLTNIPSWCNLWKSLNPNRFKE